MSVFKAMKGWRDLLRIIALRKAPRTQVLRPNVPKATGEKDLHQIQTSNRSTPKLKNVFFRSIFSRHHSSGLFRKPSSYLFRNGGRGKSSNMTFLSLIGLGLGVDMDTLMEDYTESTMSAVREVFKDLKWEPTTLESRPQCLDDLEVNETSVIGRGCEGAVFEAKLKNAPQLEESPNESDYDLAVKAVFNYGAESNASSILRELNREVVPLHQPHALIDELTNTSLRLPPHPNVVDMHCVFVDHMLVTEQGKREFPAAMPRHIDPNGCFGRNKTLYLVMRKCSTRLSDFLHQGDLDMQTRCLLLVQLLEAVSHITSNGVAHRDIKPDNILVDVPTNGGTPRLQLCDFGCCLAEDSKSLVVPFGSHDVNLGGNSWLMAPEICCSRAGQGQVLDFRKSDLWACGAVAYQILGSHNPFYPNPPSTQLSSRTFSEHQLPALPDNVPTPIQKLVKSLLSRNPSQRPSASTAALVALMTVWEGCHQTTTASTSTDTPTDDVTMTTSKPDRLPRYLGYVTKQRQKMELVLGEMFDLVKKMVTLGRSSHGDGVNTPAPNSLLKQDMMEIMNVLILSRLTQTEFVAALKFF